MKATRLLMNDSAASEEGVKLLKKAGVEFQRIPANGPSMPVLLIGKAEYDGLGQIRLYLHFLAKSHRDREKTDG